MNPHELTDKPKISAQKHVTFDGPECCSLEVSTAKDTVNDITLMCGDIVDHLLRTSRLHVDSMTLYFKLDLAGRLRLLWCSSIRMEGHWMQGQVHVRFVSTQLEGDAGGRSDYFADLSLANKRQQLLERSMHTQPAAQHRPSSLSPSGRGTPAASAAVSSPVPCHAPDSAAADSSVGALAEAAASLAAAWFTVTDEIEEEHRALRAKEATARGLVDDAIYAAVSHFQEPDAVDYGMRLPVELSQCLASDKAAECDSLTGGPGGNCVADLMHSIGLAESATGEYVIPVAGPGRDGDLIPPVGSMASIASKWLDRHFATKLQKLLSKALPLLVHAATRKALNV
jgi:hypothetical protein